ncbi:endonuclease NucS [Halogeometricum sp. wsp3]|nr:endonuclease NucS [Halogeometricum sp. wsp3]
MTAVETLTYPDPADALDLASRNADRGALVTLVGTCTVEYEGRAASSLGPGDRHVMLKPDGAALVHTDEGQQPVNWQPPGCEHSISVDDDSLVVRSTRSTPEELLEVTFETVAHAAAFDVTDSKDLALTGTEADLKDRILDEPGLVEAGFTPLRPNARHLLARSTSTARTPTWTTILELKRRRVGPDAVGQLGRYVDAFERVLHADTEVRGILVAPSVTDRARQLLAEKGLEFVSLEPP